MLIPTLRIPILRGSKSTGLKCTTLQVDTIFNPTPGVAITTTEYSEQWSYNQHEVSLVHTTP